VIGKNGQRREKKVGEIPRGRKGIAHEREINSHLHLLKNKGEGQREEKKSGERKSGKKLDDPGANLFRPFETILRLRSTRGKNFARGCSTDHEGEETRGKPGLRREGDSMINNSAITYRLRKVGGTESRDEDGDSLSEKRREGVERGRTGEFFDHST